MWPDKPLIPMRLELQSLESAGGLPIRRPRFHPHSMTRHLPPGDDGIASGVRFLAILSGIYLLFATASAATYHVDPASGQMSNPGTASQPWSTLEAVFAANKTFAAGDVILLKS